MKELDGANLISHVEITGRNDEIHALPDSPTPITVVASWQYTKVSGIMKKAIYCSLKTKSKVDHDRLFLMVY